MSSKKPGCLAAIFGLRPKPATQKRVAINHPSIATPINAAHSVHTKEESPAIPHYASKDILLTNAEAAFYHTLRSMTKDFLVIFPHIALRDLVTVIDQSEYYTYYNKIDRKQVDFVLCDPKSLKPVFVIELDDSSHNRPDRKERDAFVEEVFEGANISLVRVPVKQSYDPKELGALFKGAIEKYLVHKNEAPKAQPSLDNPPFCPRHGVRMIVRTARQTGEKFWGCPNYPHCREIIKIHNSPN